MAQAQVKAIPATSAVRFNRFLALVYLVMALGMAITALVSTAVSTNPEFMKRILLLPVVHLWAVFITDCRRGFSERGRTAYVHRSSIAYCSCSTPP